MFFQVPNFKPKDNCVPLHFAVRKKLRFNAQQQLPVSKFGLKKSKLRY